MQILSRDVIAVAAIMAALFIAFYQVCQIKKNRILFFLGVTLLTLCMITIFSLTGISTAIGYHTDIYWSEVQLVPFAGIIDIIMKMNFTFAFLNIFGNIVMFLPLGILVPFLFEHFRSLKRMLLFGGFISILIEASQLFVYRGTDIDDVILNMLGTGIGYLLYAKMNKVLRQRKKENVIEIETKKTIWGALPYLCVVVPYLTILITGFLIIMFTDNTIKCFQNNLCYGKM